MIINAVHVVPRTDSGGFMHEMDDDCPCGPTLEAVPLMGGGTGWICTHHSLDGRELRE